jgi:molecular chaperone HtpG
MRSRAISWCFTPEARFGAREVFLLAENCSGVAVRAALIILRGSGESAVRNSAVCNVDTQRRPAPRGETGKEERMMSSETEQSKTYSFKSEAQQLLDIVIHSLYSNREIFLRELISNASDALDKRRFEALTQPELAPAGDYEVRLEIDPDKRILTVWDNGVGMSRKEAIENLGTIARSGTRHFVEALQEQKAKSGPEGGIEELIGRFGVGFYATFMVADKVEVNTRRVGTQEATLWSSEGGSTFAVDAARRSEPGTTIIVHLKDADEEDGLRDFTQEWVIREVVKKYSDFVNYPIKLKTWREPTDEEKAEKDSTATEKARKQEILTSPDGKILEWETLNSMKAIWARPESEITQEEYNEFYRHISHDWEAPLHVIKLKAEGTFEYEALLFIPTNPPFGLHHYEQPYGLQLYVNRVLIKNRSEDLIPRYLRFVKGVVDSPDLSLNVSREMLQEDRRVHMIRKRIVRKVLDELGQMLENDRQKYLKFWAAFGRTLKEGVGEDPNNLDKLKSLLLFPSSQDPDKLTTLAEYVERMQPDQTDIYYVTGPDVETASRLPQMEAFRKNDLEVLYLTDPIDELIVGPLGSFDDKALKSVTRGEIELGSEEQKKAAKEKLAEKKQQLGSLLDKFRAVLQDEVKEVRLTNRLTTSAVCLVSEDQDLSPRLAQMLRRAGQEITKQKRIMEINADHPLFEKLKAIHEKNSSDPRLAEYAHLLYGQALLAEGTPPPNPVEFNQKMADLMLRGL